LVAPGTSFTRRIVARLGLVYKIFDGHKSRSDARLPPCVGSQHPTLLRVFASVETMTMSTDLHQSGAEAFVKRLAELGIDTLFANAGTDFPSIVEAISKLAATGAKPIRSIAVPHENLAIAMAYGHYLMSGRPQAIMLHVNVGTANAVCMLMNAYRERIPLIVVAGRTPFTETGSMASRSLFIHWSQEMFDQAGLVRETVKWDYEVTTPAQIYPALDRALSLANSDPKGPVYLMLPREVLAEQVPPEGKPRAPQVPTRRLNADPAAIDEAAKILSRAQKPLVITASLGHNAAAVAALASLAERFAVPVISHVPKSLCLPTDHPMHMGFAPGRFVAEADAIVVLECDVPWIPKDTTPPKHCKVIHMGLDPLFARYGIRNFPCDLAIPGDPALSLPILTEALGQRKMDKEQVEQRRGRLDAIHESRRAQLDAQYARFSDQTPIHPIALTRAIDRIKGDAVIINELGVQIDHLNLTAPGSYFQQSSAGGLGWGLGAALGVKLAAPERFVVAVVGDGSYMFGNPTPAHYIARAYDLPVLFVVNNNHGWASVRSETRAMYPDGYGAHANRMPLVGLEPSPRFETVVTASDGYGERVERPEQLMPALERAVHAVKIERRQALVNVVCQMV
jgi:acetolactate synthase-1/2/3 large subunit